MGRLEDLTKGARVIEVLALDELSGARRGVGLPQVEGHQTYSTVRRGITVKGLDCDDTDNVVTLLDLNTLQTVDWRLPAKQPIRQSD